MSTADLVFPSFLFIMGFAVPLAIRSPLKPLRLALRIAGLFLIGFILNIGEARFEFSHVRVLGVLQRISLCYAFLVTLHVATKYGDKRFRIYGAMLVTFLMATYMGLMLSFEDGAACTRQNNLSKRCNFSRWLDLQIFTDKHMMNPTDPEGLFPTLSSITTAYGGYLFSLMMKDFKNDKKQLLKEWLSTAIFFVLLSLPLMLVMPLNKHLWLASFAVHCVGIAGIMLVLTLLLVDVAGAPPNRFSRCVDICTRPLLWLGMNPLAIYVMMNIVEIVMWKLITIDGQRMWYWFYDHAFGTWISDPAVCSTVYSCFFALVWTIVAAIMFKLKIFIKL